jgi:hypothetical protein
VDLFAQRRLGDVQARGGSAEVKLLRDGEEVAKQAWLEIDAGRLSIGCRQVLDGKPARRKSVWKAHFLREEHRVATNTLGQLMERNVSEVFGERDSGRRRRAIAELYAEDCAFYEADGESIGQAAVSDRVGRILDEGAPGFAFSLAGHAEVVHDLGRLRWHLGPAGAAPVVSGMDVAVFAKGKIRTLYTFVEAPTGADDGH